MDGDSLLIDLALQGGGAHGAFTWGVLDRLPEEPWLRIDGVSGTSAGAMNAAVLVHGCIKNGADGARAGLEDFWRVARLAANEGMREVLGYQRVAGMPAVDAEPLRNAQRFNTNGVRNSCGYRARGCSPPCSRHKRWSVKLARKGGGADECHAEPYTIRVLRRFVVRQAVSRRACHPPGRPEK
jgi:hypothetical protein